MGIASIDELGLNSESTIANGPTELVKKNKALGLGLLPVGIFGGVALGITTVCFSFVIPAFRKICLPYVPATETQVNNVIKILKNRNGRVVDLGSGDGRIVIEAAKLGFKADGIELNPWLVFYSRIQSVRSNVGELTKFYKQDLWKTDLSKYKNIVIFGVEEMMPLLETKAYTELDKSSWIIACRFPLPNWKPILIEGEGIDSVWVYEKI